MPPKLGRPQLFQDGLVTARIEVRVTAAQRLTLERVASENGTHLSGLVREAVNSYVADYSEGELPFVVRKP